MSPQSKRLCMRGLRRFPVPVRLPEHRGPAGGLVPVRRSLQLRGDVQLQGLPARERSLPEPVMHSWIWWAPPVRGARDANVFPARSKANQRA